MGVVDQIQVRVIEKQTVASSEKIVRLFEPHTDIIVKSFRYFQYRHKINLSCDQKGFIIYLSIEKGNPSDKELFMPVLLAHQDNFNALPK